MPQQFDNPSNPQTHFLTTGPEVWEDTDGQVDILVIGVGTGGSLMGIGGYLKSKNPALKVVALEPENSAVLSGESPGGHKIQGIGAGFIPSIVNTAIIDKVVTVSNEDAMRTAQALAKEEGIFCGISSGAAMYACLEIAKNPKNKGKNIVTIFPDSGDRYISTDLFL